jgi:hypothetical protein
MRNLHLYFGHRSQSRGHIYARPQKDAESDTLLANFFIVDIILHILINAAAKLSPYHELWRHVREFIDWGCV